MSSKYRFKVVLAAKVNFACPKSGTKLRLDVQQWVSDAWSYAVQASRLGATPICITVPHSHSAYRILRLDICTVTNVQMSQSNIAFKSTCFGSTFYSSWMRHLDHSRLGLRATKRIIRIRGYVYTYVRVYVMICRIWILLSAARRLCRLNLQLQ